MAEFPEVFDKLVEKNAFQAIEKLMYEDTELSCVTLLGIYTETLGALYSAIDRSFLIIELNIQKKLMVE